MSNRLPNRLPIAEILLAEEDTQTDPVINF